MDKELPKRRRNIVSDYRKAVLASITLKKHIEDEWSLEYDFYLGGAELQKENKDSNLTPDLFLEDISGNEIDLVGDIKRSLPSNLPEREEETPVDEWQTSEEVRSYLETRWSKITDQLKRYDSEFVNCTNPHDIFFLFKNDYSREFNAWLSNLDYASQNGVDSNLNYSVRNNLVGLAYHEEFGSDVKTLRISKEGSFSNGRLNSFFENSECEIKYNKCPELIGGEQIAVVDEAHQAPPEYIMLILWLNIFDEINRNVYNEDLLERVRKYEKNDKVVINADLDSIINYLDKYYVVDVYDTREGAMGQSEQFNRNLVKRAMRKFEKIDLVEVQRVRKGENPKYEIEYEPLTNRGAEDALGGIIEALDDNGILSREGKEPDRSEQKKIEAFSV